MTAEEIARLSAFAARAYNAGYAHGQQRSRTVVTDDGLVDGAEWVSTVARQHFGPPADEVAPEGASQTSDQSDGDGREQALKARAAQPNTILKAPK